MQRWFLLGAAVTLMATGGGLYAGFNWPSEWEPQAQATLAAALIALVGTLAGATVKAAFDEASLRTRHRNNVQSNMLDRFYTYAGRYLLPLAAAAAEAARYLREYSQSKTAQRRIAKLDNAFYSAAQYIRLHATFQNTFSLPNAEPPLGILLSSHDAERRVWNLVVPPWALGVSSLVEESILLEGLNNPQGKMRTPKEFIELAQDPSSPLHSIRQAFIAKTTSANVLNLIDVLNTLNVLINYEVGQVFAPWYKDKPKYPKRELKRLESLPSEQKQKLGIFYR